MQQHRLGTDWLVNGSVEKAQGILVGSKQHEPAAQEGRGSGAQPGYNFPCVNSQAAEDIDWKGCAGSLLGDFQDQPKRPEQLGLTSALARL